MEHAADRSFFLLFAWKRGVNNSEQNVLVLSLSIFHAGAARRFFTCGFYPKRNPLCGRKAVTFFFFLSLQLTDGKTKLRKINAALKKNFRFQVDQWLRYACSNTM